MRHEKFMHCNTSLVLILHLCSQFERKKSLVIVQQSCVIFFLQYNENNLIVDYNMNIISTHRYNESIGNYEDMWQHVIIFLSPRWYVYLLKRNKLPNWKWWIFLCLFKNRMWCIKKYTCKIWNIMTMSSMLIFAWHTRRMRYCMMFWDQRRETNYEKNIVNLFLTIRLPWPNANFRSTNIQHWSIRHWLTRWYWKRPCIVCC